MGEEVLTAVEWPNLFIVGVARGATSSLARCLGQHRDIYMSPLKEPYYFSSSYMCHRPFPKDEDAYLGLFAGAGPAKWRGEASTAYFWDEESATRIKSARPDARILISLRDPVERAYSGYWHAVRLAGESRSFLDVVRAELRSDPQHTEGKEPPGHVGAGFYVEGLERYSTLFGDSVHVLFFEDFAADPRGQLRETLEFLEVDGREADRIDIAAQNASLAPRNAVLRRLLGLAAVRRLGRAAVPRALQPRLERIVRGGQIPEMDADARQLLEGVYAPERERLERLLGRALPW